MLRSQPLCTNAESNLGDRVLGEVEKNSFIALPGKDGYSRLLPSKTMCRNPAEFGEEFYGNGSRVGLLIRLGCVQGLHSFNLILGNLFFLIFKFYLSFLYSRSLLVINFIHISVYMSIPITQFSTPPLPPTSGFPPLVSICLFSTSVSQFLPCKLAHLYHFSHLYQVPHICVNIRYLFFSF